jgi:hypothetical protein
MTRKATLAPGGEFQAQLESEFCAWGFGLAANRVSVKIEKLGSGGWSYTLPLEYDGATEDQGSAAPTLAWVGPSNLEILVHTQAISGVLTRRDQGLTVVRSYVSAVSP